METDLLDLLSQWRERSGRENYSADYKCALNECIYDLQSLLDKDKSYQEYIQSLIESLPSEEIRQYMDDSSADEYNSSMQSHEQIA